MAEDCQLSKLQNEFKKLRVDFNSPPFREHSHSTTQSKVSESVESGLSKSRPARSHARKFPLKYSKVLKQLAKPEDKKQFFIKFPHHAMLSSTKLPPSNHETKSCNELNSELLGLKGEDCENCDVQLPVSTNTDDTTVDELAAYFDTFVHIPKKMSQMAEMMYT